MLAAALSFAAVLSAAPETSRAEIDLFGGASYATLKPPAIFTGSFSPTPLMDDEHSVFGAGGLGLTLYLQRPLVDTEAPLSLQPYLERVSTLRLEASGGGFDTVETGPLIGTAERTEQQANMTLSADIYVTRNVIVGGSLGFKWSTTTDTNPLSRPETHMTLAVPVSVTLGGRFHDTRVDVSWGVHPVDADGNWRVPFWGGAGASVQSVFRNCVHTYLSVNAVDGGAFGTLAVSVYPYRRFGLFASFFGGGGQLGTNATGANSERFGATLGLSLWHSRHFGGAFSYNPTWTGGTTETVEHFFALQLFSRVK